MEARDYRVIPYSAEHTTQILQLQQYLWGRREEMNAAYFDWKYMRNPYIREPLIYLAVHGEQVVGMRGFVGAEWEFGSPRQTIVLPLTSDVVTAPDHRKRGLLTRIMETALKDLQRKGYSYVVCMAAVRVTCESHRAAGWQTIGSLRPMDCHIVGEKPLPLHAFLSKSPLVVSAVRKLLGAGRMASAPAQESLIGFHELSGRSFGRHISVGTAPRGPEMAKLKRRLTKDSRIRHVYDAAYYEWRFQNPRNRYRFLFWDNSELEGYLILQSCAFRTAQPIGIVDWEASSDKVRTKLLRAALQLVDRRTVSIWSGTLPESERRVLETAGFKERESALNDPQTAEVRPLDDDMLEREWRLGDQRLLDLNHWDFRMLHSRAF